MGVEDLVLTRLAVVPTPGSARAVAVDGHLAVAGDSLGVLTVLDLEKPLTELAEPRWRIAVGAPVWGVAVANPVAFAGLDSGSLVAVHLEAGILLDRIQVAEGKVEDVVLAGRKVVALVDTTIHLFDWDGARFRRLSSIRSPGLSSFSSLGRSRLFTDRKWVWAIHRGGFNTFDITGDLPILRQQVAPGQIDWKHLITPDGVRGSAALGLSGGLSPSDDNVSFYALNSPAGMPDFLATLVTPEAARAVLSRRGLVHVADHLAGLQVMNLDGLDRTGVPPTVTLHLASGGTSVAPHRPVEIVAEAFDNLAVREVEFFVNGLQVYTDTSFPFSHRLRAPSSGAQFVITARAVDLGGNPTDSDPLNLTVLPDTNGPLLVQTSPFAGAAVGARHTLVALFDERLDPNTVSSNSVIVRGARPDDRFDTSDDTQPAETTQQLYTDNESLIVSLATPLPAGRYRVEFKPDLADPAGFPVVIPLTPYFRVVGPADMTDTDRDGLPNAWETEFAGTDPQKADSNGNGILDGDEDSDGDGLTHASELVGGTDPTRADSFQTGRSDSELDLDGDALTFRQELLLGTDPGRADTDDDGWNDEAERTTGSRATDPRSRPWLLGGSASSVALVRPAWEPGVGQYAAPQLLGIVRPVLDPIAPTLLGRSGLNRP